MKKQIVLFIFSNFCVTNFQLSFEFKQMPGNISNASVIDNKKSSYAQQCAQATGGINSTINTLISIKQIKSLQSRKINY